MISFFMISSPVKDIIFLTEQEALLNGVNPVLVIYTPTLENTIFSQVFQLFPLFPFSMRNFFIIQDRLVYKVGIHIY